MRVRLNPNQNPIFVDVPAGMTWNVVNVVGPQTYNANPADAVLCDDTQGLVNVVLPDATTCKGESVLVKATQAVLTGNVEVTGVNGQTIDGNPNIMLSQINNDNAQSAAIFVSDGANWFIGSTYQGHA
jgi:hypothetical protein